MHDEVGWSRRRWLQTATAGGLALGVRPVWASGPGQRVLDEVQSPYNHIVIGERGSVVTMYFIVDGTSYIESRLDRRFAESLDLDYTRTMMAGFLVRPQVRRLLMIGFGGGQISNYLFRRFPGLEVDGVDIDAEVIALARKHFRVPDSPRYRTHAADGRVFVEQSGDQTWDMIILDAFRGVFVPFHLKTLEYYQTLRRHLSPGGVVVANLHRYTDMYHHDRETFEAAFGQCYAFTSENERQISLVAANDDAPVSTYAMRDHARALGSKFDFDLLGLASRLQLARDWSRENAKILRDDFPADAVPEGAERHNDCRGPHCSYPVDPK